MIHLRQASEDDSIGEKSVTENVVEANWQQDVTGLVQF